MTNKQLAQAEKKRAEARARAQVEWLRANGAWNWHWPAEGNCWDTGLPEVKRHRNAHQCNFTSLPGQANKRHSRRRRALAGSSYRKVT